MTPETRAARDRLARYAAPDAPPFPPLKLAPEITHLTPTEARTIVAQITDGIRETLAPDLQTVLAALDLHARQAQEARVIALREISRPGAPIDPVAYEIYLATGGEPVGGLIEFPAGTPADDMERFRAAWDAAQGPERTLTLNIDNRTIMFKAKPWPDDESEQ